ncbi:MAG: radical SAM protein [Candidatus Brocadiae bacterium]|nr:radical SAM protein [Candidatus Brocadiia bacterium]
MEQALAISEIFKSIEGETSYAGLPCSFVRTMGCNLRCSYCDTGYAQSGEGIRISLEEICKEVASHGTRLVCITGGEPLMQAEGVVALAARLLASGHTVLLETNGTFDLAPVPEGVVRIMDVKCPGSGESGKTLPGNLERLTPRDEVKFVISDRADFDWAVAFVEQHGLAGGPQVLFAPAYGRLAARELAGWILEAGLQVRLQLQLHKLLWPERTRGV